MLSENTIEIREIPHSIETEQQILGNIILNDKLMEEISDIVKPEAFYLELHQKIYNAMLYLYFNNIGIGYETLGNRLEYKEKDNYIDYLIELGGCVASTSRFENHLELLVDIYRKRKLYELYKKRLTDDLSGIASTNLVKEVEGLIDGMGVTSNIEVDKFEDYVDVWLENLEDTTPVQQYKLGFEQLDDLLLLEPTNLMIIGARPSIGKSAFATNLVKNFCLQGKNPLFISLEMNKKEYMNRLVANMAKVEARKIKRKQDLDSSDWAAIMKAKEKIKEFKFNFYDKGGMKVEQLVGLAKYLKKKGQLDVLVIDYLQLLESNQYKGQKQNQVTYISQKLKQIAMELEIPVIALSQLSRAVVVGREVKEPQLSDLRDSGKKLPVIPFPLIKGVHNSVLTMKP